ncbi:keratin, type II cytoskeletal 75 [Pogona vitticeps]
MTQQIFAARMGGRGFSSASAACGLGGRRTYVASIRQPVRNGYGIHGFGSRSLSSLGGNRRISYGRYGAGCYGSCNYGHAGYGGLGFGGMVAHYGPGIGSGGPFGGYSNSRGDGIHGVRINEDLLKPLQVGVDLQEQEFRNREREEMKDLNNQFACFIDKVRSLEQQNKALETKWNLLQEYALPARKNLEPYYENFISNMKKEIDYLLSERENLARENDAVQHLVEELKSKYEEEFKRRTAAENEFVLLKKDVDSISLSKTQLEGKVDLLCRELEFRRHIYAEELAQLDSQIGDAKILLQMDNSRDLDLDLILRNVDAWYQSIAQRSKEEANAFYENRFQELQEERGKHSDALMLNQQVIAQLTQLINKLQRENDSVKKQVSALETAICDVEQRGDNSLKDAREKHTDLQTALKKAKDDLAGMLKDYQLVLNSKVALDIEIAAYKSLLEGEETRLHKGNPTSVDVVKPFHLSSSEGYSPMGIGYNSGYGGWAQRSYNRSYGSRSVGEPSRTKDSSHNLTPGVCSADAEFHPGAVPYSRSCYVGNHSIDSSCQTGGVRVGRGTNQGLGFGSGIVHGSIQDVGSGKISGGIAETCPGGGYLSGGYRPVDVHPFGDGGMGRRVVSGPIVVGCHPGFGIGNIGGPCFGIPAAGGFGVSGGMPCVGAGGPLNVCYPGAVQAPVGVCYPGQVGDICFTGGVAPL